MTKLVSCRKEDVELWEPDYLRFASEIPNDLLWKEQWGLKNTGGVLRVVDADIDADEAWDITRGSREVVVAVLDGGIKVSHPDLRANIRRNSRELARNRLDDDGNGLVDDHEGWNFSRNTYLMDFDGDFSVHGSMVAGIVAAVGNNAEGISGVSPVVSLLPVQVLNGGGLGLVSNVVAGMHYAVSQGADITCHSYAGSGKSAVEEAAVKTLETAGVLMVAAVGNDATNVDSRPLYPACFASPAILSVGATDARDLRASFSNLGVKQVDLSAPGVDIVTLNVPNGYIMGSGTSFAAPMVAGAAALVKAAHPDLSGQELREVLMGTVDVLPALKTANATSGRLNAARAVLAGRGPRLLTRFMPLSDGHVTGTSGDKDRVPEQGEVVGLTVELRNEGSLPAQGLQTTLELVHPHPGVTIMRAGQAWADIAPKALSVSNSRTAFLVRVAGDAMPGPVDLRLTHQDRAGQRWFTEVTLDLQAAGTLAGRVATPKGVPISGATVNYTGPISGSVRTAANGRYSLTLPHGSYRVMASLTGREATTERPVLLPPNALEVDFMLGQPRLKVTPASLAAALAEEEVRSLPLTLENTGDAALRVTIEPQITRITVGSNLALIPTLSTLQRDGYELWQSWLPKADWRAAGRYGAWSPLPLIEGFESGSLGGFIKQTKDEPGYLVRWVAAFGAAPRGFSATGNGSLFYRDGGGSDYNFAFRRVAYGSRPRSFGVSVRRTHALTQPLHVGMDHFPIRDPREKRDPLTGLYGTLFRNSLISLGVERHGKVYASGEDLADRVEVPMPDTRAWCRLEAVNIDWQRFTFDFRVDGQLIRAGIPFRRQLTFDSIDGVSIFGEETVNDTWIDDLMLSEEPLPWVLPESRTLEIAAGGKVVLPVRFSAAGLRAGSYGGGLDLRSNDPARPLVSVPVSLTVKARVNKAPVAETRTVNYLEDQPVEFSLPTRDAEGDALLLEIVDHPSLGQVGEVPPEDGLPAGAWWLRASKRFIYTPQPNHHGTSVPLQFRYRLRDYALSSGMGVISFVGQSVPDAPVAVADLLTIPSATHAAVLFPLTNDRDDDGDAITIISLTPPAIGSASIAVDGRSILYTPPTGVVGLTEMDLLTYTISDGKGGSATTDIRVSVALQGADWPTQGGSFGRAYSSPVSIGDQPLSWRWSATILPAASEPIIVGQRAYIAAGSGTDSKRTLEVSAHDLSTGFRLWTRTWQGVRGFSHLTWQAGSLYLSLHQVDIRPDECACLRLNAETGETRWQTALSNGGTYASAADIVSAPVMAGGVAIFQRSDQYPVPAASGSPAIPTTRWHRLDAATGAVLEARSAESLSLLTTQGMILAEGGLLLKQPPFAYAEPQKLNAEAAASGSQIWSIVSPQSPSTSLLAAGPAGAFGINKSSLYRLNVSPTTTQRVHWQKNLGLLALSPFYYTLAVSDTRVVSLQSQIIIYDSVTGTELARQPRPFGMARLLRLADATLGWSEKDPYAMQTSLWVVRDHATQGPELIGQGGQIAVGRGVIINADGGWLHCQGAPLIGIPAAHAQTLAGVENENLTITLTGTSNRGESLRRIVQTLPTKGQLYQTPDGSTLGVAITVFPAFVEDSLGRVILVPEQDYSAALGDNFTFQVQDSAGISAAAKVQVKLAPRPSPPRAVADRFSLATGGELASFRPESNDRDPEGGTLSISANTLPDRGTLTRNGDGSFRYQAAGDEPYTTSFGYTLKSSNGLIGTETVTLIVDGPSTHLWSMKGGHGSRRSYYPGNLGTQPFVTAWTGPRVGESVVAGGGRIYALALIDDAGLQAELTAFSNTSGSVLWRLPISPSAILTCDDSKVYAITTDGNPGTTTNVQALAGATGDVLWTQRLQGAPVLSHVITSSSLVLTVSRAGSSETTFLNLMGGRLTNVLRYLPTRFVANNLYYKASLAASSGIIYLGTSHWVGPYFYGYDETTGNLLWLASDQGHSSDGLMVTREHVLGISGSNWTLSAVRLSDHIQAWTQTVYSPPSAATQDNVIAGKSLNYSSYPKQLSMRTGNEVPLPGTLGSTLPPLLGQPQPPKLPQLLSQDLWIESGAIYDSASGVRLQTIPLSQSILAVEGRLYGRADNGTLTCLRANSAGNTAPLAVPQSLTFGSTVPVPITLGGSDADGDALEFIVSTLPAAGTLHQRLSSGLPGPVLTRVPILVADSLQRLLYLPDSRFTGSDSFSFAVFDPESASAEATISLSGTLPPVQPLAMDDRLALSGLSPLSFRPQANDHPLVAGAALTVTAFTQGSHGVVTASADGGLTYTPAGTQPQDDRFTYTITDGAGAQATAEVILLAEPNAGGWTHAGANAANTRFVPLSLRGLTYQLRWSMATPSGQQAVTTASSFLLADGQGCVLSTRELADSAKRVDALSATTGFPIWTTALPQTPGQTNSMRGAAWHRSSIYLVSRHTWGSNSNITLLNSESGLADIVREFDSPIDHIRLTSDVVATAGSYYEAANVRFLSSSTLGVQALFDQPPILDIVSADEVIAVLTRQHLRAIHTEDGSTAWVRDMVELSGGQTPDFLARADGRLLVTHQLYYTAPTQVICLDERDGTVLWQRSIQKTCLPALGNGAVYVMTGPTEVSVLDLATGLTRRTYAGLPPASTANNRLRTITVTQDTLMVTREWETLLVDLESGMLRQTLQTGEYGPILSRDGIFASQSAYLPVPAATPVNQPPGLPPAEITGVEDTHLLIALSGLDPEGDACEARINHLPAQGRLYNVLPDGSAGAEILQPHTRITGPEPRVIYQPPLDLFGSNIASVSFSLSDGRSASVHGKIGISLSPMNDGPNTATDSLLAEPGELILPVPVLGNDRDPEGDAMSVTSIGGSPRGRAWITSSGALAYEAPADMGDSSDSFTYTVTDVHGTASAGRVQVTLAPRRQPLWYGAGGNPAMNGWSSGWLAESPSPLAQVWLRSTQRSGLPIAIAKGRVFCAGSGAEQAQAFDAATGGLVWYSDPASAYSPTSSGMWWNDNRLYFSNGNNTLVSLDALTGEQLWRTNFDPGFNGGSVTISGVHQGRLCYQFYRYQYPESILKTSSLRLEDGSLELDLPVYGGISSDGQFTYLADSDKLHILDLDATPSELATITGLSPNTRQSYTTTYPAALNSGLAVTLKENWLSCVDIVTRRVLWHLGQTNYYEPLPFIGLPALSRDHIYIARGPDISCYEARTGSLVRTFVTGRTAHLTSSQPMITDNHLIYATSDATYLFDLHSGVRLQTIAQGGHAAVAGDKLYLMSGNGDLSAWASPAPVTFSPAPSTHPGPAQITLTTTLAGAVIHYTTDGSTPNTTSPSLNSGQSITLTADVELRAIALTHERGTSPNAATGYYHITSPAPPAAAPPLAALLPADQDTDGDGATDVEELLADTRSHDAYDVLQIIDSEVLLHDEEMSITWSSKASCDYVIEISSDLKTWTLATGVLPGTGEAMTSKIVLPPNLSQVFARVRILF
jgi:outer membrane protein assembly factor BamB